MKNMQDIDRAIRTVEAKVERLKAAASEREARVRSKIAALRGFTASEEATDSQRLEIRKALAALESKMQNILPPLEEVEKEVNRIYGDQSLNDTYYFSRRNLKSASMDKQALEDHLLKTLKAVTDRFARDGDGDPKTALINASIYLSKFEDHGALPSFPVLTRDLKQIQSSMARAYAKGNVDELTVSSLVDQLKAAYAKAVGNPMPVAANVKVAAFLRQGEKMEIPWTDLSYDQVQDVIDDIYGNQSDNSTYYFNRAAHTVRLVEETLTRKSSMSLQQIMDQMDSLYGDLSKNETYYPSRRHDEQARIDMVSTACDDEGMDEKKKSEGLLDEQHHLLSEDFSDSGHQNLSAGYEIPGYFANDNFDSHNTVAPTYRVDNTVETFGYGGDEVDEMPHVVQNRHAATDFLGMGLHRHGVRVEKTRKGTMLMWDEHPMLSTDRAIVSDEEPYTVTFYKGRKEVVNFRRLGKDSLVRILKDHMGLNLRQATPKTAALKGIDVRVLQAFLDHRPMEGKMLMTDGVKLEKMGMGGRIMAEWVRGKVEATDETHVKSDETILRALKKHTPRNLLITSPTL